MNRRALVGAVLVALVATAGPARAARPTPIPPASLFSIERTIFAFGFRTIALPRAYSFLRWGRHASAVPGHVGQDTIVAFAGPDGALVTWAATRLTPQGWARCADLYGSRTRRFTVDRHVVYVAEPRGTRIAWMCVTDYGPFRLVYRLRAGRQFTAREMATIVGRSRFQYSYAVASFTDFWMPSRNIGCFGSIPGQGLDPGLLTCYIRSGLVPSPGPPTGYCRDLPKAQKFGWGDIVSIWLPVIGNPDGSRQYDCAEYEPVDPSAPTLAYGHTLEYGGVTCRSERIGLRCANRFGHGFFLSRQYSYLF